MDVREAHVQLEDFYWNSKNYSYVWKTMAQLARGILQHAKNWKNRTDRHNYVINQLGRSNGETFLGEAMPLPASKAKEWLYPEIFPSREAYLEAIWPQRRKMWADLIEEHKPRYIVCFGMGPNAAWWGRYKEILPKNDFDSLAHGRIQTARFWDNTKVYLSPFFRYKTILRSDLKAIIEHALAISDSRS